MSRRGRVKQVEVAVLVMLLLYIVFAFGRGLLADSGATQKQPSVQQSTTSVAPPMTGADLMEGYKLICDLLRHDTSPAALPRTYAAIRDRMGVTPQEVANFISQAVPAACPELEQAILDAAPFAARGW